MSNPKKGRGAFRAALRILMVELDGACTKLLPRSPFRRARYKEVHGVNTKARQGERARVQIGQEFS